MNMDETPFDDRDIYWKKDSYFKLVPFTQVLAGRGCPYPCTYCFNDGYKKIHIAAGMKGKDYTNVRSVPHVIEELKMLEDAQSLVLWGRRKEQADKLPMGGWARLDSIHAGKLRERQLVRD